MKQVESRTGSVLPAGYVRHLRREARSSETPNLAKKLCDLDSGVIWAEEEYGEGSLKIARGSLNQESNGQCTVVAYWCGRCRGWLRGLPREEKHISSTNEVSWVYHCSLDKEVLGASHSKISFPDLPVLAGQNSKLAQLMGND